MLDQLCTEGEIPEVAYFMKNLAKRLVTKVSPPGQRSPALRHKSQTEKEKSIIHQLFVRFPFDSNLLFIACRGPPDEESLLLIFLRTCQLA